jgi:hypothetical protein
LHTDEVAAMILLNVVCSKTDVDDVTACCTMEKNPGVRKIVTKQKAKSSKKTLEGE